jgi:hypothetical protein
MCMLIKRAAYCCAAIVATVWLGTAVLAAQAPSAPKVPSVPAVPAVAPAPVAITPFEAPAAETPAAEAEAKPAPDAAKPTTDMAKEPTPITPPEEVTDTADTDRARMKDLLFDSKKKQEWVALSAPEREKVLKDILPTMTFNGLSGAKLDEATPKVNECTGTELSDAAFEGYDVATAITKCLFKLGYAP